MRSSSADILMVGDGDMGRRLLFKADVAWRQNERRRRVKVSDFEVSKEAQEGGC
jgi:hypothetical protein